MYPLLSTRILPMQVDWVKMDFCATLPAEHTSPWEAYTNMCASSSLLKMLTLY